MQVNSLLTRLEIQMGSNLWKHVIYVMQGCMNTRVTASLEMGMQKVDVATRFTTQRDSSACFRRTYKAKFAFLDKFSKA